MGSLPRVTLRTFNAASAQHIRTGLLGWITVEVDGLLVLDGITLRRTASTDAGLSLSFPERRDGAGRRHSLIRPIDDDARRAIEEAVLGALAARGATP